MIRGAQKQMIVVRTGDSRYFDEAYFVLRREVDCRARNSDDLLREAEKILEERGKSSVKKEKGGEKSLFFLLGSLAGALLTALIFLLF